MKKRFGNVVASIWENKGTGNRVFHSVTVEKIYKDGEKWTSSQSFDRDELPKLQFAIENAYRWFFEKKE